MDTFAWLLPLSLSPKQTITLPEVGVDFNGDHSLIRICNFAAVAGA